jgi:hypothetical protein
MNYSKKTIPELKAICKERKIKGISGKKKQALIELIMQNEGGKTDVKVELSVKVARKEVQAHGFSWEKETITNIYHATNEELKEIKYTGKTDLPAKFNRLDNCDISVKTTGSKNAVCMGDCLRVFDAMGSGKPIHMVVIHYIQDDTTNQKKVTNIIEIDLTNSRDLLFGTLTRSQIEDIDKAVKSVPQKRKPTEEEYKKMYSIRDSMQELSGAIHLDIKCNSTQSRLQCSFNHFQQFIEKNPSKIIAKSDTNEFRGGSISSHIASSRRVFKKKPTV